MTTFERWLQERLNAFGAKLVVDGDIGRASIAAIKAFQTAQGIPVTGVADNATVDRLQRNPVNGKFLRTPQPTASVPPWMYELVRRMGLHEVQDKTQLTTFLKEGAFLGDPAKLPWCGDAVESAFAKTLPDERLPSNAFFAQNWKTFGRQVEPMIGCVGVIRWSASAGHVGFVSKVTKSQISMVGGNQSNAITNSSFPRSAFIAYRWPSTFPITDYPTFNGATIDGGGIVATR